MNVRANKSGIAFGKFAESDNVFDSGWNIRIPAGYSNVDHSVPVAGDVSDIVKSIETIKNAKSVLGSAVMDGTWYGLISARHRNGSGDGTEYGLYLRSLLTSSGNLIWGKQYGARSWQSERIILDSLNYTSYCATASHNHNSTYAPISFSSDSGWKTLWSSGDGYIKYRKIGPIVYVQGISHGNAGPNGNNWWTAGTLPIGYRPSIEVIGIGTPRNTTGYEVQYNIQTDGAVKFYNMNPNSGATCLYWAFNTTFIAD